jgi:hypothetical protein
MRCCQNKTSFSWSYRDSSKRSLENNVMEGKEKNTHTWDRWTCANGKEWSRGTRKSSLSDCTWLENEYGSFDLEALKFLMHFREPGSLFYFYSYSHFFLFFFSYINLFFFIFLSFSFSSFFSFSTNFFICSPFELYKLHCTYLLPHA